MTNGYGEHAARDDGWGFDHLKAEAEVTRERVAENASRIIDALMGRSCYVRRIDPGSVMELVPAPESIPYLEWTNVVHVGVDEADTKVLNKGGSVGAYTKDLLEHSADPSEIADTAFYAGVLAATKGLVDPAKFQYDLDPPNR